MAKNLKKKLKKLKRKVKALQDLNTSTESRLDRLELDISLLHANQSDYEKMFEDLADNQHDIALNAMVKDLSEEELDEVFNELVEEEFLGDSGMDDEVEEDSDKEIELYDKFLKAKTEQEQDELRYEWYNRNFLKAKTEQEQDELRNEYHGKFDAYNQQHIINPRQKI